MTKPKNLVITSLPAEYIHLFKDLCEAMELSRDQLLILLLTGAGHVSGGLENIIDDEDALAEWREMMVYRIFALSKL
jgi:hypothetical protein